MVKASSIILLELLLADLIKQIAHFIKDIG
jgi:hypothetical protein